MTQTSPKRLITRNDATENQPGHVNRRKFLSYLLMLAGGTGAIALLEPLKSVSAAILPGAPLINGTLFVPPLLAPNTQNGAKQFNLTLQRGQSQLVSGFTTTTLGINGNYLGPTLRAKRGDDVVISVTNQIGEETTLHWHGMHLPAAMDGGPHQTIATGSTWSPRFTIAQPASTLWYHPHLMGQTESQVLRGLVGMFILEDELPVQALLPHNYGVDDLPLIFQDQSFDNNGQFRNNGGGGRGGGNQGVTLVNGSVAPVLTTDQTRIRLRLLNASNQSFYNFGFADNHPFQQIASDGGLLPNPVTMTRLSLGAAERAEIIIDLTNAAPLLLQNFGNGRTGSGTTLLTIKLGSAATISNVQSVQRAALPAGLVAVDRLAAASANVTRDMVLAGADRGRFTINGQTMTTMASMMNMNDIMTVRLGDTEVWTVINNSDETHMFHVHDVQFQILSRSSGGVAANEIGSKDTVRVNPGETVKIIMRFTDFADPNTPYMFHCHILEHEDEGMMGQFVVVPA